MITAEMPSADLPRALASFAMLLGPRQFTDLEAQNAMNAFLNAGDMDGVLPEFAKGIFKELIKDESTSPLSKKRNGGEKLTQYVKEEFVPQNLRLYVLGAFDPNALDEVKRAFDIIPGSKDPLPEKPVALSRPKKPTQTVELGNISAFGRYLTDPLRMSAVEYLSVKAYFEDFGQTHKDHPIHWPEVKYRGGLGNIDFEFRSYPDKFEAERNTVETAFKMAGAGRLTDEQVQKAIAGFTHVLTSEVKEWKDIEYRATWTTWFMDVFNSEKTPAEIWAGVDAAQYKAALAVHLPFERMSRIYTLPSLFFQKSRALLMLAVFIGLLVAHRVRARKQRPGSSAEAVGIVGYSVFFWFGMFFRIGLLSIGGYLLYETLFEMQNAMPWIGEQYYLRFYVQTPLYLAFVTQVWLTSLSAYPRQVFLTETDCALVAFLGKVKRIPFTAIDSVELRKKKVFIHLRNKKRPLKLRIEKPDNAVAALTHRLAPSKTAVPTAPVPAPTAAAA